MGFELCFFHSNLENTLLATQAGVHSLVIDLECIGKRERQRDYNTQINRHTFEDLHQVRQLTNAYLICRINPPGPHTPQEVERAICYGANELLIPMIRTPDDLEMIFKLTAQRIPIGILIETIDAIGYAEWLGQYPLNRAYIGLNDLAIETKSRNLFLPLINGAIESIRPFFSCRFGFAGLTLPNRGHPIPCSLIIGELLRLNASFSFLRRSFWKDTAGISMIAAVAEICTALQNAKNRSWEEVTRDRTRLVQLVQELETINATLL